jgi:hypothetical protein
MPSKNNAIFKNVTNIIYCWDDKDALWKYLNIFVFADPCNYFFSLIFVSEINNYIIKRI